MVVVKNAMQNMKRLLIVTSVTVNVENALVGGRPAAPASRMRRAPRRPPVAGTRRPRPASRTDYVVISRDGLKLLGFALCCHSNATRAPIANPPNSAQLGGSLYHAPKLHPGPCSSVGVRMRTDRHTDARDHNTFCIVYDSRKM